MMPLAVCLCLLIGARGQAPVQVEHKPYEGWSDAYWVSNDTVEIVVVPAIGRVMRYARLNDVAHTNLLWENVSLTPSSAPKRGQWMNYGGDKVWVAPQTRDSWPPDPKVDPGPYQVEVLPNGVKLTGPSDDPKHVRITRQITLGETGSKVSFVNMLQNLGDARKMCPWQVTQLDNPEVVILGYRMSDAQQAGYYNYGYKVDPKHFEHKGDEILLTRDPQQSRKFGACALDGEIRAIKGGVVFHIVQQLAPGAKYPDHNSPQQVYLSADPLAYAELEQVGPLESMETDEVAIQQVQWFLTDRTP